MSKNYTLRHKVFLMVFRYALFKLHKNDFEFPTASTFAGGCVITFSEMYGNDVICDIILL